MNLTCVYNLIFLCNLLILARNIQYDGVTNIYHTPFLIDLINSGSMTHPDLKIVIPERFVNPGERHHLYVPGSGKAILSIIG